MTEKRFFTSDDLTAAVNVLSSSPLDDGTWAVITDATLFQTLQAHLWVDPAPNGRFGSGI